MGVDYTHMRSFVIDNSWSYEIILRVWICRSGIPFCRMVFTVTPHELHGVTNQRPIYCLFNSMYWLTTKDKNPNSLTWNVIFIISYSRTYKITHSDVWVCRSRNRVLQQCLYSDATWAWWRPISPTVWQFAQQHVLAETKRKSNWRRNQL